jgi:putative sterol carrier protein
MGYSFPSEAWLHALCAVLNSDTRYAEVARAWEGDILCIVEPDAGAGPGDSMGFYFDLWHGACRRAEVRPTEGSQATARFVLRAARGQFLKVVNGELDPMQAMVTRRLRVDGDMAYMLRNVPVVLDFVRCARKVEIAA